MVEVMDADSKCAWNSCYTQEAPYRDVGGKRLRLCAYHFAFADWLYRDPGRNTEYFRGHVKVD